MPSDIFQTRDGASSDSDPVSKVYQIPNILFMDPTNRKLKVLTIGAGISGILMAYQIQASCEK